MAGRVVRGGCGPRRVRSTGRGWRECAASGFIIAADDYIEDVRQGPVAPERADITPGFGTYHPQDVKVLGDLDDPSPIDNGRPPAAPRTFEELGISDQERLLALRENRPPRRGY